MLPKLYYISQGKTLSEHFTNIQNALLAGIRMIQVRLKELTAASSENWFVQILEKCKKYDAICIINDEVDLALSLNADGVHVGRDDEKPSSIIKKVKNKKFIIGSTANNSSEFQMCIKEPIGYIGLGPVRQTTTKKNLSPILGINGIQDILYAYSTHLPIYAIGGIRISDVKALKEAGCYGVAVSGDLSWCDVELLKKKVEAYNSVLYGG